MFDLQKITRPNIQVLKPYSAARDEYQGKEGVFLDANENTIGSAIESKQNRYPDPLAWAVKKLLAPLKGVQPEQIFLGNGSDEAIDLLFRSFCYPGKDQALITPPTYGMYEVNAQINDIEIVRVNLDADFQIIPEAIIKAVGPQTKMIILCSPNNPTGNCLASKDIEYILNHFDGIVAVDEAYIDFAPQYSMLPQLSKYPNLVVLQTFSKAWGLANLRLGIAFASKEIIQILNKVKPPYNVNGLSQQLALDALQNLSKKEQMVLDILKQKAWLLEALGSCPAVLKIYPSDANFILVKTTDAKKIYRFLVEHQVIVRDRSSVALCEDCLRITVGTLGENLRLIEVLSQFKI